MNAAADGKEAVIFFNTEFSGVTDISDIVTSMLAVSECRAFADFLITYSPEGGEYQDPKDKEWSHDVRSDREYDIEFLDLANSVFYEDFEALNVYRFMDLQNTRFKATSFIDDDYLNLSKGRVIRKVREDRRLVDDGPRPLQELWRSCDSEVHEWKRQLYLSVKTFEREDVSSRRKVAYYLHEWVSDYGKSPVKVLFNIMLVNLLFGLAFYCAGYGSMPDCMMGSCSAFFTIGLGLGGLEDQMLKSLVILEGAVGFVMMTYFVVVLCDWKKSR